MAPTPGVASSVSPIALAVLVVAGGASEAPAQTGDPRPSVAVMSLDLPETLAPELRSAITAGITEALDDRSAFEVTSVREVAELIDREQVSAILREGEPDFERLARLGSRLEADYVVVGGLIHDGPVGRAHLQLLRVDPPAALERVSRDFDGPPERSVEVFRTLVRLLVRDLLAERSGQLRIEISEEGATVYVNQQIVGSSPLPEPVEAPEGLNTVAVEREGFIRHRVDVVVQRDRETEVEVLLVPSQEFIASYRAAVVRRRWVGWGLIGFGAVAGVGSVASQLVAADRAEQLNADIGAYNRLPPSQRTSAEFEALQDRESDVATFDVLTVVGAAAAVASVGTGVVLLATNPPLDRYDAFVEVGERRVELELGLSSVAIRLRF